MKLSNVFMSICIVGCIALACTGCLGANQESPVAHTPVPTTIPKPMGTAVPVGHYVVTEKENNATLYLKLNNTIALILPENPSTGYSWNMTIPSGLGLLSDSYVPSDTTDKVLGSGGIHVWNLTARTAGEHKIQAIYKRSWESVTGDETTFILTVVVT